MSSVPVDPATAITAAEACANCGKEGSDAVKLKNCTACFLVKYCGVDCQKIHRKLHKKACRERAAELKDEKLYGQGHERAEVDFCTICLLAVPFPMEDHASLRPCCTKMVCNGCSLAAYKQGLSTTCPFCRESLAGHEREVLEMIMKRVAVRDPEAICHLGDLHIEGIYGLEKSDSRAVELWTEAAELGSTKAHHKLGIAYHDGRCGVPVDKAKGLRFLESAAMEGEVESRHGLGLIELEYGKNDRAIRHLLISAKMGYKPSLDKIKEMFARGLATRAQFAEGLKGYQDAVEEKKSSERDALSSDS